MGRLKPLSRRDIALDGVTGAKLRSAGFAGPLSDGDVGGKAAKRAVCKGSAEE